MTTAVATIEEKPVTYLTDTGEVTLSVNQVKRFVAKGNKEITLKEAVEFVQLCRFNKLNPFVGDAFLIKYGQDATMVTSKYAYMKRAEAAASYNGFKAGVVLLKEGNGDQLIYREGAIVLENEKLIGGWSEVDNGRKIPVRAEVKLEEYLGKKKDGTVNKIWRQRPATQIRKVALVGAHREAFPNILGGLYSQEEISGAEDVQTGPTEDLKEPIDVTPGTTESKPSARRRRNKYTVNGEEVKTAGITGQFLTLIQRLEADHPGVGQVIDNYLDILQVSDVTFLRDNEGKELLGIIGKRENDSEAPGEPQEDKPIAELKTPGGKVACPDRGDTAMEVSHCQTHCEKYPSGECVHFPLADHEKPANNGITLNCPERQHQVKMVACETCGKAPKCQIYQEWQHEQEV